MAAPNRIGQNAQDFVHHGGGHQRRIATRVEWRRNFYNISTDEIKALGTSHQSLGFDGCKAADFGGAGAGREYRIQRVDIEGDVGWAVTNNAPRQSRLLPPIFVNSSMKMTRMPELRENVQPSSVFCAPRIPI